METGQKFTILSKTNKHIDKTLKKLSVQISLTGLSFFVKEEASQQNIFFSIPFSENIPPEVVLDEIKKGAHQHAIQLNSFDEITIIYAIALSTLVPLSLFDTHKKSEYLKFNSKILATDYVSHDTIESQDIAVVYIPYININNFFLEQCDNVTYYHSNTVLLNYLLTKRSINTKECFLYVQPQQVAIFVIENNTLQLANSFEYQTPEDFIYYILFVFEQLKSNPEEIKTTLFGNIKQDSPLFEIAYQYIRNIDLLNITDWGIESTENPNSILHHLI